MKEEGWTEGKWRQQKGVGYCCIRTGSMSDGSGRVIADMRIIDGHYNHLDASLIASAKDLYNTLMEVERCNKNVSNENDFLLRIRRTLAKARGEE